MDGLPPAVALHHEDLAGLMLPLILFLLFVIIPLLEIAAFIKIGEAIGVIPTLLGCVVTAVIGAFLVRLQGFGVLRRGQEVFARGELPVDELAHGVMILVAGVLLMTPGYVTDTMGFLLLVPPVRLAAARVGIASLKKHAKVHVTRPRATKSNGGVIIEGEAVDITDDD